jgi:hypothetical protein
MVMANFWTEIVDVRGAFLTAEFELNHKMFVSVPQGFEKSFPENVVLLLKKTMYGTCQAAIQFWKKLCVVTTLVAAKRSQADVCLFYQWTAAGLLVYMSWVDDILIAGKKGSVLRAKKALAKHFTLDEQGEMLEYIGCKVEHDRKNLWMKLTQPVMIQSFVDEFDLPDDSPKLPAPPGEVLTRDAGDPLDDEGGPPTSLHLKWLYRLMNYVRQTAKFGNYIKPSVLWDGPNNSIRHFRARRF